MGIGLTGLNCLMGYMGCRNDVGSYTAWKNLQEEVSIALESMATTVINDNLRKEMEAIKKIEGNQAKTVEDRLGLTISIDTGWQ